MQNKTQLIISELKEDIKEKKPDKPKDSLNSLLDINQAIEQSNLEMKEKAETQKIFLRKDLTKSVKCIIWFQLLFFNIIILVIVLSITMKSPYFREFDEEMSVRLFGFLKYYITATIAELLGMLWFILRYVFSGFKKTKHKKQNNL